MQYYTAADQVASGKVQLSTLFPNQTKVRNLLLSCSGTGPIRFGDSSVGAAQGFQIAAGASGLNARTVVGDVTDWIDLTLAYIFVPSGTTASITVGK